MQLLLNIKDSNKANVLLEFLKSLNYVINVKTLEAEEEVIMPIKNSDSFFVLDDSLIAMLDKRAETPNHDGLSLEESNLRLSAL